MFIFKDSWILIFIPLIPFLIFFTKSRQRDSVFLFSSEDLVRELKSTAKLRFSRSLIFFRAAVLILMLLALGRPQSILEETRALSEGVDIVLTLDTSTSMLGEDFKIGNERLNRFDVVRDVVKEFIKKRREDRIGMVAFAGRAYTVCPLTTDYSWLIENLDRVRVGMIEDATAIGSAITSSLNRLRTSKTKSKVIILLTDGINNAGNISPLVAAEAARALKVKIYAVGVGTKGLVPYPMKDIYGRTAYQNIPIDIDEESLKKVADLTAGRYYRATDTETLRKIYDEIDRLEKSNIEHFGHREHSELFPYFLIPGLIILAIEIFLSNTLFVKVP